MIFDASIWGFVLKLMSISTWPGPEPARKQFARRQLSISINWRIYFPCLLGSYSAVPRKVGTGKLSNFLQ